VENPREIVEPGTELKVKILEIDSERRRLSLSAKRVEGQVLERRDGAPPPDPADDGDHEHIVDGELDNLPELGLSEDVFAGGTAPQEGIEAEEQAPEVAEDGEAPVRAAEEEIAPEATTEADAEATAEVTEAPVVTEDPIADQDTPAVEVAEEAAAADPEAEAVAEPEAEAAAEPEAEAAAEPEAEPAEAPAEDDENA
jgi:small subunit ribosomal protein S1